MTDIILFSVKRQMPLVCLNDISMFKKDPDDHKDHMRQVLTLINDARVTVKLKPWSTFTNRIYYLSHVIKPRYLPVSSHTINATCGL